MVFDNKSSWGAPQTLSLRVSSLQVGRDGNEKLLHTDDNGLLHYTDDVGACWVDLKPMWDKVMDESHQTKKKQNVTNNNNNNQETYTASCHAQVWCLEATESFNEHGDVLDSLPVVPDRLELELRITVTKPSLEAAKQERMMLYKHDDDLRQEMFAIQFFEVCDALLKSSGLDLKILRFRCTPVGARRGFIEWVPGSVPMSDICIPFAGSILAPKDDQSTVTASTEKKPRRVPRQQQQQEEQQERSVGQNDEEKKGEDEGANDDTDDNDDDRGRTNNSSANDAARNDEGDNDDDNDDDGDDDDDDDDEIAMKKPSTLSKAGLVKFKTLRQRQQRRQLRRQSSLSKDRTNMCNNPVQDFLRSVAYDPIDPYLIRRDVMDTYVKSCAGYCVLTYLLGVGDRHLDNLLLHQTGHFFHCDFTFLFGRDPKKYLPVRITEDMILGMGGLDSDNYAKFMSLVGAAFIALRRHENVRVVLSMVRLMAPANLPDISVHQSIEDVVLSVRERLRLDLSDDQAVMYIEELIKNSISSKMWIAVDAIHSLGKRF